MIDATRDERFERLRPRFRNWLLLSTIALVIGTVLVAATYGDRPPLDVDRAWRTVIAVFCACSLIIWVFCGAMLVYEWLLRKYVWSKNGSDGSGQEL